MDDALDHPTLRATLDRIIPSDNFPGAWEAGVGDYIARQLAGDLRAIAPALAAGLHTLEAEALLTEGASFALLPSPRQDALLARIERGEVVANWPVPPAAFFARLVRLAAEGYYGDPDNGGNRDRVSWHMVGYRDIP